MIEKQRKKGFWSRKILAINERLQWNIKESKSKRGPGGAGGWLEE